MIEFIQALIALTLWGSFLWGIALVLVFLLICIISDVNENGFLATTYLILAIVMLYFWGDKSYEHILSFLTWKFIIIYLVLGLMHSLMRSFFHGREQMDLVNEHKQKQWSSHTIDRNLKHHVARWWFLWPISLSIWIIKDKLKAAWNFCWNKINKVFDWFMELGIKSVPELPEKYPEKKK